MVAAPSADVYDKPVPRVLSYPCDPHHRDTPSDTMPRRARGLPVVAPAELSTNPDVARFTTVLVSTSAVEYTMPATLVAPAASWDPEGVA